MLVMQELINTLLIFLLCTADSGRALFGLFGAHRIGFLIFARLMLITAAYFAFALAFSSLGFASYFFML